MQACVLPYIFVYFIVFSPAVVSVQNEGQKLLANHPCNRPCILNQPAMTCSYNFTVEWFRTMSRACGDCPFNTTDCFRPHCNTGDGKDRLIMTLNRKLPAPTIQVCEGDRIVAWVYNDLEDGSTTSLHWHGIHQHLTPFMDGAPHVTQCPIQPYSAFKYNFTAYPAGTTFYHSHTGMQFSDGMYGALIVMQAPEADVNFGLYDRDDSEHVVLVGDWLGQTSFDRYSMVHDSYQSPPWSAIINGRGRKHTVHDAATNRSAEIPLTSFHVTQGLKYRFRIIHAGQKCFFRVSVDNHALMIIATDGQPVSPASVDAFLISAGETMDVVIHADQPVDNYWLRAKGLRDCLPFNVSAAAILRYRNATEEEPKGDYLGYTPGTLYAPASTFPEPVNYGDGIPPVKVTDLNSTAVPRNNLTSVTPDLVHYLSLGVFIDSKYYTQPEGFTYHTPRPQNNRVYFTINDISFTLPREPLLTQWDDVDQRSLCNGSSINVTSCHHDSFCACTHLVRIQLGQVVQLVISNGIFSHAMHLHGNSYHVLALEPYNKSLTEKGLEGLDKESPFPRKLLYPPVRNTLNIPPWHYAILQFKADNPGVWLFHCHQNQHILWGQALAFQVGQPSDLPRLPDNFPRCSGHDSRPRPQPTPSEPCPTSVASVREATKVMVTLGMLLAVVLRLA